MEKTDERKRFVRKAHSFHLGECEGDREIPKGISMTVPDESYTIRELLNRHVRGMRIDDVMRQGTYEEESNFDSLDLEKVRDSDLVERDQVIEDIKAQRSQALSLQQQKKLEKEKEKKEKEREGAAGSEATPASQSQEASGAKRQGADASASGSLPRTPAAP